VLKHLPLILKNSVRNKRRSILTVGSVAASLCLLGVLGALYFTLFRSVATPEQALRLIVRNRVSLANPLPLAYGSKIRQAAGVEEVCIFQWFGGTYKDNRDPGNFFARIGLDHTRIEVVYPEYRVPADQMKAFLSERTAALLGKKTADRHKLKIGDRITIIGDFFPVNLELTIRGIFDHPLDRESLVFRYDYLNELLPKGRADNVSTFVVKMRRPEDATSIIREVDGMFRNATMQTKTETEKAFELSFLAFLGNLKVFLLSICAAVTFTILLVAGNTMAMSVRERVREVGILKTLGFTPAGILGLILGESVAISLIGGAIGVGLAHLVCAGIRQMPSMFANMNAITVPAPVAAICLAVAAVIGLISCVVPAWTASRRPIVESLRFTD